MKSILRRSHILRLLVVSIALAVGAARASAVEWTRVTELPVHEMFSTWANGDTVAAGADTVVFLSTDAGAHWLQSARPTTIVAPIDALLMRNGRLYAGTYGQGVFVSDDLGSTWTAYNQGLVGGFLDSQLFVVELVVRGDNLYAATAGAGVYERGLVGANTWHHFGEEFEPNQASNVNALAVGGTRLIAPAGDNGMVFVRDPGDAGWTVSNLDNVGIHAGLQAGSTVWTGTGWIVGSNLGLFSSVPGEEPWTRFNPGLGPVAYVFLATHAGHTWAAFDIPSAVVIEESADDGATWQFDEILEFAFVERMAVSRNTLYAARTDGLWRRLAVTASVDPPAGGGALHFALAGAQPSRDDARVRFVLPESGPASIEVFDVTGRAAGNRIDGQWSPGAHEVSLDTRALRPGVYLAVLSARGVRETVRVVHVR